MIATSLVEAFVFLKALCNVETTSLLSRPYIHNNILKYWIQSQKDCTFLKSFVFSCSRYMEQTWCEHRSVIF